MKEQRSHKMHKRVLRKQILFISPTKSALISHNARRLWHQFHVYSLFIPDLKNAILRVQCVPAASHLLPGDDFIKLVAVSLQEKVVKIYGKKLKRLPWNREVWETGWQAESSTLYGAKSEVTVLRLQHRISCLVMMISTNPAVVCLL